MSSLRRQLTRALIGWIAALLVVALAGLYAAIWWQLNRAFDVALEARALGIAALVEQQDGHVELDFQDSTLRGFGGAKPRHYFMLLDAAGGLLAGSRSLGAARLELPPSPASRTPAYWNLRLPNSRPGRAVRFLFEPKTDDAHAGGPGLTVQLVVAADREDHDEVLGGLFAAVAGIGLLLLGGVLVIVPRVLRVGLVSVARLGEQAARIDADTLSARFPVADLPAELQPIGARLNDLLARLEASFERERRFSADLAHELRTPLAELRSLAECALKWPETRDAATDRDALAIALHMEALVTRLLTLARGERGQLAAQPEAVELAAFVAATWRPFAPRAAARSLRFRAEIPPGTVQADPVLLRAILNNLFDNAVDYAPAGGEITVSGGDGLRLANAAGNLAPEDVTRLFDRFWRKDEARSEAQHVGLGLNLARVFAAAMGWKLTATLEAGQLVFWLKPA
jgi:two-component system sensor histidine kinase QseC